MQRIFLTAAASSALAFAAPAVALAHDGEHQQAEHQQGVEDHTRPFMRVCMVGAHATLAPC